MISLSDSELNIVMSAAAPLRPKDRAAFLEALSVELAKYPEVGPGLIFRLAKTLQRGFYDPPDLTGGPSKWDG